MKSKDHAVVVRVSNSASSENEGEKKEKSEIERAICRLHLRHARISSTDIVGLSGVCHRAGWTLRRERRRIGGVLKRIKMLI